jgi:hypothetical protein
MTGPPFSVVRWHIPCVGLSHDIANSVHQRGETMKLISAIALIGLLAACNAGATTPSEQPLPTVTASVGTATSPSASTSAAAMSCTDAFAAIDLSAMASATDLMTLSDKLDATISSCQTLDEWTSAVQTALPQVDTTQAQAFIQQRCAADMTLAATPLCTEVGS